MDSSDAVIDPHCAGDVARALEDFVRTRLGASGATLAEPPQPVSYGWETYIYLFHLREDGIPNAARDRWASPLVLRLYAHPDQFERTRAEEQIQDFVVRQGYQAPRPIAVGDAAGPFGLPFVIMERLPGEPLLHRISRAPLRAGPLIRNMAALHADLHRLDPSGWPFPEDGPSVERATGTIRAEADRLELRELDSAIAWLDAHKHAVIPETLSVCHNDFHPMNIIIDEHDRAGVVDWGGATAGDRHFDVANTLLLLRLVPNAGLNRVQRFLDWFARRILARIYLRAYEREFPLDAARVRYWQALAAVRWWLIFAAVVTRGAASVGLKPDANAYVEPRHVEAFRREFRKLAGL